MSGQKAKYRFESEVHLGLLAIILLLLMLSALANYFLFSTRVRLENETLDRLQLASVAVQRQTAVPGAENLAPDQVSWLCARYGLSGVTVVPSQPAGSGRADRARWLAAVAGKLPSSQWPEVVDRVLRSDFKTLTRGGSDEYFLVTPLPTRAGGEVAILSVRQPDLGHLQDGSRTILWTELIAAVVVGLLYAVLSRTIFRPFRKIKEQATLAGRGLIFAENEADSVAEEYKQIIQDLRDKEAELLRLNEAARSRADSLEVFNRYLLSSIESGIITVDREGKIQTVNQAVEEILRIDAKRLVGEDISGLFPSQSEINGLVHLTLRNLPTASYKEVTFEVEGGVATLGVTVSAIRDLSHELIGAAVLINDLTEVVSLRKQVESQQRLAALGEMSAGLAHQLRNSVGAISGYGTLIRKKLQKLDFSTDPVDSLITEAKEAEELIGKLLTFARPMNPVKEQVLLDDLLRTIIESYRQREDCAGAEFTSVVAAGAIVEADPLLLKQAIMNLIDNGIQACDGKAAKIAIRLSVIGQNVAIDVRDNGAGITPDKIEKIFTPFYSGRPSGTGLGLPLACRVADLHGGKITVQSTQGEGSCFTLHLPLQAVPAQADR